jgi:replicative DNA helicase
VEITKTNTTSPKPRLSLLNMDELAQKTPAIRWLIDDIMVAKQPMVIGGPMKSLKTSLALDLAVSLGSGTPFLNRFQVKKQRRVAMFSGESGQATIHETIQRICKSKRIEPKGCWLHCGFKLPRLGDPIDRNALKQLLRDNGIEVVIIDPLYLCLIAGSTSISPSNLYEIGAVLSAISETCLAAGATLVLLHHTTKTSSAKNTTTTLNDLAFSGIGEFSRQWLLVSRPEPYQTGSGVHRLNVSIGGSAGHSSQWRVCVNETTREKAPQRRWHVEVKPCDPEGDEKDDYS